MRVSAVQDPFFLFTSCSLLLVTSASLKRAVVRRRSGNSLSLFRTSESGILCVGGDGFGDFPSRRGRSTHPGPCDAPSPVSHSPSRFTNHKNPAGGRTPDPSTPANQSSAPYSYKWRSRFMPISCLSFANKPPTSIHFWGGFFYSNRRFICVANHSAVIQKYKHTHLIIFTIPSTCSSCLLIGILTETEKLKIF